MRLGGDVDGLETETQNRTPKPSHNGQYQKLGKMVCHRIILNMVARDLSTFAWCKVLLSCIADAVDGGFFLGVFDMEIVNFSPSRTASIQS